MTLRMRQILMEAAGEGGAGGGGAGGDKGGAGGDKGAVVKPEDARAFVGNFVEPDTLKGWDDTKVVAEHTRLSGVLDKVRPAKDWKATLAGEDASIADLLKDVEDPKILLEAHKGQARWRESLAGDNKDALKTLERFASPKALWESYEALRTRVSKGELKNATPYPEKGTAEQQAAWRAENGIPDAPDKYEIKLPANVEVNDATKPVLDAFAKFAHGRNLSQGVVNDVANWYLAEQVRAEEAAIQAFEQQKTDTAATLGQEWGPEYKGNLNRIQGVLDATIPAEQAQLKELIKRAIDTNPHFARHYAAIALQLNPAGSLVPGDRGANEGSITDEIKKIEKVMRDSRPEYDKDEGMQKKYRTYLEAYEKLTGKQWGVAA